MDGSHVKHAKPAPDLLLLAASRLRIEPQRCWAIGDSTWDMRAAVAGGLARVPMFANGLPLRWFSLFALGMVVYDVRKGMHWKHGVVFALACADLWYRAIIAETPGSKGWLYLEFVAGSFALVALAAWARPRVLRFPPLVYVGTISYCLYLLHQNIGYVVIRWAYERGAGPNLAAGIAIAVAIALASALSFGIERPAVRLVKRLTKKKPAATPGV